MSEDLAAVQQEAAPEDATPEQVVDPSQIETEGEAEPEAIEEVEFDFGGNKFKAPKTAIPEDIATELDKFTKGIWQDYTRKGQEVAEKRKSLEAAETAVKRMESLQGEALQLYAHGTSLKNQITQIEQALPELWRTNPDEARRWSDQAAALKGDLNRVIQATSERERGLSQTQQQETARRMEEGRAIVNRAVKGFDQQASEVVEYAVKTYGIPKEEAEQWPLNPVAAIAMQKAMMFDRLQAKAKAKATAPATPMTAVSVKGGANIPSDPAKMNMEQYAAWFEAREAKKRR